MAADARSRSQFYLERMKRTVWPLVREYWFDALIVVAALGGALELALGRDDPRAPDGPLAVGMAVEAGLTLMLLARRWFPFGAPAGMLVAGTSISFVDGELTSYTFSSFLSAASACFLLGMLAD